MVQQVTAELVEPSLQSWGGSRDAEGGDQLAAPAVDGDGHTGEADLELVGGEIPLTERPRLVVLNKVDVPEARELAEMVRPELEARFRELLPAVEIDGELAFTYFVDADALRARLVPSR